MEDCFSCWCFVYLQHSWMISWTWTNDLILNRSSSSDHKPSLKCLTIYTLQPNPWSCSCKLPWSCHSLVYENVLPSHTQNLTFTHSSYGNILANHILKITKSATPKRLRCLSCTLYTDWVRTHFPCTCTSTAPLTSWWKHSQSLWLYHMQHNYEILIW